MKNENSVKQKEVVIDLTHRDMTEKECYESIKKLHKKYPDLIMNPDKWLKLHRKKIKEKDIYDE